MEVVAQIPEVGDIWWTNPTGPTVGVGIGWLPRKERGYFLERQKEGTQTWDQGTEFRASLADSGIWHGGITNETMWSMCVQVDESGASMC